MTVWSFNNPANKSIKIKNSVLDNFGRFNRNGWRRKRRSVGVKRNRTRFSNFEPS
jgi:hypothetical protein